MSTLVYLAGPYTNPDPVENTHNAIKKADQLERDYGVTVLVPHLTALWHLVSPKPYDHWLAYDIELLKRCDVLYRMPGKSSGADGEVRVAVQSDIPVVCSDWVLARALARL